MNVATQVLSQAIYAVLVLGAMVGIAGFVIALCLVFANPNAQYIPFAPGESVTLDSGACNKRYIVLGPSSADATLRLPVCAPNSTIELYPATGYPSGAGTLVRVQDSLGNPVQTNAATDVEMNQVRRVSCNEISGAWSCVVMESI